MTTPLPVSRRREFSLSSRTQRLVQTMDHVEMDIPVLKKFFVCLPLRAGLYIWGIVLLMAITSITIQAIFHYSRILFIYRTELSIFAQASVMYVITMLVTLIEVTFAIMLLVGTKKKRINILTTVYRYYTVKMFTYGLLLLTCFIVMNVAVSESWFYRNVDPVRKFVLYDSPICGFVDFLLQMYVAMLIRSEVIHLRSNYQPVYHVPLPVTTLRIPYQELPDYVDPKDMFKY